ncbi:MAG: glycosyltransferase [Kofleriaceae bacterium]
MRIVIFGLTVSSAWGNGHATLWRSLIDALDRAGHVVVFYERDLPYYRHHRDLAELSGRARLRLYASWEDVRREAAAELACADAALVTSYCPDGRAACELVLEVRGPARVFYDLDTPVTLARLDTGEDVPYLPSHGLGEFDLVLSYTGGRALELLRERLGARRVAPLYGSVDPRRHYPVAAADRWTSACSYLGTWSDDRQAALEALFLDTARRHPERRFVLGGSQYPADVSWPPNVVRHDHVAPADHPAFYCSSPVTLSITREPMAKLGYCPSGRLFEAAACGVPVLSDAWDGVATFFSPGEEILIARTTAEASEALARSPAELAAIGARARARVLDEHTGQRRAVQLIASIEGATS